MTENNYWSSAEEQGTVRISEDVVASIASIAVTETEGVSSLCAGLSSDIAGLLGKKSMSKGTKIVFTLDSVAIDVGIVVKYGVSALETAKAVQANIKSAVEAMAGLTVSQVNVKVCGVSFTQGAPEEEQPQQPPQE